jgi:hypothetical protein
MRTHEDNDTFSIFLPAFDHLIVFFLCHLPIHEEERPAGAIPKLRLLFLILIRPTIVGQNI